MTTAIATQVLSNAIDKIEGVAKNIAASPMLYTPEFKVRAQRELSELVIENLPEIVQLAREGMAHRRNRTASKNKVQVASLGIEVLKTPPTSH